MNSGEHTLSPWQLPKALDDWLARTEHWGDLWSNATGLPRHRRVLLEALEALAGRFAGRTVQVERDDTTVRFALDEVAVVETPAGRPLIRAPRVVRPIADLAKDLWSVVPGGREVSDAMEQLIEHGAAQINAGIDRYREIGRVELKAHDVMIGTTRVTKARALVEDPRLEPATTPVLVTGPIRLDVTVALADIEDFARRTYGEVTIAARADGRFVVTSPASRWTAVVSAFVHRDQVDVRVERVRRRGIEVPVPRRKQPVRTFAFPVPSPMHVVAGCYEAGALHLQYHHPGLRQPVSFDRIRDLVATADPTIDLAQVAPRRPS